MATNIYLATNILLLEALINMPIVKIISHEITLDSNTLFAEATGKIAVIGCEGGYFEMREPEWHNLVEIRKSKKYNTTLVK